MGGKKKPIEFQGKRLGIREWARELDMSYSSLARRIENSESFEEAVIAPKRKYKEPISFNGRTMTQAEWAREIGISQPCLHHRIRLWGIERALSTPIKGK